MLIFNNCKFNISFIWKFKIHVERMARSRNGSSSASGSGVVGRDPVWKYCTPMEMNKNETICNYCGLTIKIGGNIHFKFHLSHIDPHSNTKKMS